MSTAPSRIRLCLIGFLAIALGGAAGNAVADRFVIDATNPGAISNTGRNLSFDLSAVPGEIKSAQLVLNLNYSNARELSFQLVDSGGVVLPISPVSAILTSGKTMVGSYKVADNAVSTWALTSDGLNTVPNNIPVIAYQNGLGGQCKNLLGRYLEFDINKAQPLTLEVNRLAAVVPGSGVINSAQLIIDNDTPDEIMATGFEEPATPLVPCKPPSLNVVLNGQNESISRSNLVVINYSGANQPLRWYLRDFVNPDFGPIEWGMGADSPYVGRFGGRNRMNLGFWNAATGTVTFTTGTGGRTISVPGDWANTFHLMMPGDYDGDGVTDVAVAFQGAASRWVARIRFSRTGNVRDFAIDPRSVMSNPPLNFTSNIGIGAGEDGDRNGVDEIQLYAEVSGVGMHRIQWVMANETLVDGFLNRWGALGDLNVRGKWIANSAPGDQFGLMVARKTATNYQWFAFPNSTPTIWGLPTDIPLSINQDGDAVNDYAVYRPSDRKLYYIESSTGAQRSSDPLGSSTGNNIPLGRIQGVTAPLEF